MRNERQSSALERFVAELCGGSVATLKTDDPFFVGMQIAKEALRKVRRDEQPNGKLKKTSGIGIRKSP